ncbi:hypothetical protein [Sphingorhabdus sp. Alg239-R122]|uniref:hypothetical protein n=1 Tax=Sphingorhabdus sp. Alg239-R122 TaxID=2305989 RepID=UPI0013D94275|nr:hypothetical protein [Sphingorhabdus sp. Alg239-R122]
MMEYNFYASYPKGSEIRKGRVRRATTALGLLTLPLRGLMEIARSGAASRSDKDDAQ